MEACAATLQGRDCLLILPTGGGKSLTYQLPPAYREQIAVVVTPLLALSSDQAAAANERGLDAASWDSRASPQQLAAIARELQSSPEDCTLRLLYTTPESLATPALRELLAEAHKAGRLCSLAIDEAHVAVSWGHDFRPSYLMLSELRDELPGLPVIAMTATATKDVQCGIVESLGLKKPVILHGGFNRPNIEYRVQNKECLGDGSQAAVLADLLAFLQARRGQSGIIYCRLRATCDWLADALIDASNGDIDCAAYHAGKDGERRARIQRDWSEGGLELVVATVAFGMGIDKADVRYVVHWDPPSSIEGFYQESGRGGRDGAPCLSLLYASQEELRKAARMEKGSAAGSAAAVAAYVSEARCRRARLLAHFGERRAGGCDPSAGEAVCDCCANPVAVRSMKRAAERRAEAAFEAAAAAAAEEQARQQQEGRQARQRSWGRDAYSSDPYCRDAYSRDPYERTDFGGSADGSDSVAACDAQDKENEDKCQEGPVPPVLRPNPFCTGHQAAGSGKGGGSAATGVAPQQQHKQLSTRPLLPPGGSAGVDMASPAAPAPAGGAAAASRLPDGGQRRMFKPLVPNGRPPKKACIAEGQHQKAAAAVVGEGQQQLQAAGGMQVSSLPAAATAAAAPQPPPKPIGLGVRRPFKPPRMVVPRSRAEP